MIFKTYKLNSIKESIMIARKALIVGLMTVLFISLTGYAYIIIEDKVPAKPALAHKVML